MHQLGSKLFSVLYCFVFRLVFFFFLVVSPSFIFWFFPVFLLFLFSCSLLLLSFYFVSVAPKSRVTLVFHSFVASSYLLPRLFFFSFTSSSFPSFSFSSVSSFSLSLSSSSFLSPLSRFPSALSHFPSYSFLPPPSHFTFFLLIFPFYPPSHLPPSPFLLHLPLFCVLGTTMTYISFFKIYFFPSFFFMRKGRMSCIPFCFFHRFRN